MKYSNKQLYSGCDEKCKYLKNIRGEKSCWIKQVNPKTKSISLKLFTMSIEFDKQIICDYNEYMGDCLDTIIKPLVEQTDENIKEIEEIEEIEEEEEEEEVFQTNEEAIEYLIDNEISAKIEKAELQLGTWNCGLIMNMAKWSIIAYKFAKKCKENGGKINMRDSIKFCIKQGLYIPPTKRKINAVKSLLHKFRKEKKQWPKRVRLKKNEIES